MLEGVDPFDVERFDVGDVWGDEDQAVDLGGRGEEAIDCGDGVWCAQFAPGARDRVGETRAQRWRPPGIKCGEAAWPVAWSVRPA